MYGRTRGELPIEPEEGSAGIKSVTLSDQRGVPRQPDTTTSKKKLAQYAAGTHAHTVGAVIRSATAVSNHVSETAGTASRVGTEAGPQLKKAPLRLEGEVDKVVFGGKAHRTGDDERSRHFDDRDFLDAAGSRTGGGTQLSGAASLEAPLTFEQIPHSEFVAHRRKANVPTTGSMSEELMYNREIDVSDHLDVTIPMYVGAAGESTQKSAVRYEKDQLSANKTVRSGNSVIDSLVFMHDMDNSEADDEYVEGLYRGCFGNRASGPNVHHPFDMSTRRCDHLTGDKIYGFNSVHGTDLDGDTEVVDPRDFENCAGTSTKFLAERYLSAFDVTMRTATVGSNLVHPTQVCIRPRAVPRSATLVPAQLEHVFRRCAQVDEVIFGHNLDRSGADPRDFEGAAGHGGTTHHGVSGAIVKGDVTTEPQRRHASEAAMHMVRRDMTMDEAVRDNDYGEARGWTIGGNAQTAAVPTAGQTGNIRVGANHHTVGARGDVKRSMVSEVAFDALNGGASQVVRELVERNPKFDGSAGLTAHRFIAREDGERGQGGAQRRVEIETPVPVQRPPRPEMTAEKKLEYGLMYGSQVDGLLRGQPEDEAYKEKFQGGYNLSGPDQAGLTSIRLQKYDADAFQQRQIGDYVPLQETQECLLEGSAGTRGSVAAILARSRKGGMERRALEPSQAGQVIQQDRTAPEGDTGMSHIDRNQRTYSNARASGTLQERVDDRIHDNLAGHASGEEQKFLLDNRIHGPPKITSIPGRAGTQRNRTPAAYADQFDEVSRPPSNPRPPYAARRASQSADLTPRLASGCLRAQHRRLGARLEN
tara:strand:- start:1015 stop:3462 length:2448 start_codon:yes stop_codon:yes gene_type:complete